MTGSPPALSPLPGGAERLAALARYAILDTPPERDFDDIVLIATQLCAAPIGLVSLVAADRQWFKARIGFSPCETPIGHSVCAHALDTPDGLLVISDLSTDPRTRDNPLVTGPEGLRFYAGAPLTTPEGAVLGTLCVLDTVPRAGGLPEPQQAGLRALARQAMNLLELRRGLALERGEGEVLRSGAAALAESELRLRLAVEATGVGIFDYDPAAGRLVWDAGTREMFGIGPDEPVSYEGTFLPGVHPEDRDRADQAVRAALDPSGPGLFACEYRTIDRDGRPLRWVAARGRLTVPEDGAARFVGTVRDITAERSAEAATRASEERYRLVTRATNDAIWDWDLVADHVLWNEALGTAYGWAPEQVEPTGQWWLDRVHPEDRVRVEEDIRAAIFGTGIDWNHEYRFLRADGRYADVLDRGYMVRSPTGAPLRMIGAMLDLTERKRAEAQLRAIFEGANVGIVQLDPRSLTVLRVNARLCAIWGAREDEIVGYSVAHWTPEEDAEERDRLHRRLAAGEIMRETLEKRFRRGDGRLIWARVNLVAQMRDGEMLTTAMIDDITAEKSAEARHRALLELGDRLRDARGAADVSAAGAEILGRTLEVARAGYAAIDGAAGTFTVERDRVEPGTASLAGRHDLSLFPATVAQLRRGHILASDDVARDPRLAADAGAYAALGIRAQIKVPLVRRGDLVGVLFAHHPAPHGWSEADLDFAREAAERIWATLGRIHAEDQQRLLNRELSHRLKNTLAMVQAITTQTLRNTKDIDEAREALVARLIALGKTHDVLLSGETESAQIDAVIADALAIHDDRTPGRFALEGPALHVGPKAALSLALTMHELATNAAKYGALSLPGGRVVIVWRIEEDGADPRVHLTWTERGGPPVTPPGRAGFGSRLIERGLASAVGAQVVLAYDREGVSCRIAAPLSGLLAKE